MSQKPSFNIGFNRNSPESDTGIPIMLSMYVTADNIEDAISIARKRLREIVVLGEDWHIAHLSKMGG